MKNLEAETVFDLEYFFELSPDLLCVAGYDGYFKKINPAVCKTLGYTEEELFSVPINTFVHPDDRERTAQKRKAISEGEPLLHFENRYLTKFGKVIWLSWTSMPIKRDRLVFAIAKDVTYQKQLEEYDRISAILGMVNNEQKLRFKKTEQEIFSNAPDNQSFSQERTRGIQPSYPDQVWLNNIESIIRKHAGRSALNLHVISDALAVSERQLFRTVHRILGITPNRLVRIIRLQLAWEAIRSGKHRTITEISNIAGYTSRAHFSKIFKEIYGIEVRELL